MHKMHQKYAPQYFDTLAHRWGTYALLPHVFTASFLYPDPPLSPPGSDLLKSFLKSILVPTAIILLYNTVLTTTSKPTFILIMVSV